MSAPKRLPYLITCINIGFLPTTVLLARLQPANCQSLLVSSCKLRVTYLLQQGGTCSTGPSTGRRPLFTVNSTVNPAARSKKGARCEGKPPARVGMLCSMFITYWHTIQLFYC
ncbi:hypothetical protein F4861DRAFT_488817 [Xylaria intraflava]|nr:hypothetical protein F4861DRAFT_488817 [Xylaria intraflava]